MTDKNKLQKQVLYYDMNMDIKGRIRRNWERMIKFYLVWLTSLFIIRLPFAVNSHNLAFLNMACCITQTIDFINPNDVF